MSENVIDVRGLSRTFGKKQALCDVSLVLERGVVLGLVGENGAGKTTLIKHLLGLLKAQAGTVRVFGVDPVRDPVGVLSRVGYLSEDREMPTWMRVEDLVRYHRAFYSDWDDAYAAELLDQFELPNKQPVSKLSRGQKARAGLLIALAHRPDLLILDEPSSGLDPIVRRDILAAIIRTVADEGRNVLFSSHLLDEVQRVADRVAMLHAGRVVLCDELDAILNQYSRLTLHFDQSRVAAPDCAGALSWSGAGREWSAIVNGAREQLRHAARDCGATVVEERSATLDEIFVARADRTSAANPSR